jgi:hypothetical protein
MIASDLIAPDRHVEDIPPTCAAYQARRESVAQEKFEA